MKPYVHLVEELLRRKTHILIYNGQNDLIVETPGTFKWVERIHHDNADQFRYNLYNSGILYFQFGKQEQKLRATKNKQATYS